MLQGTELFPGAWVLRNSENERNMIALFDAQDDGRVVGVDPGDLPVELDALDKFAVDMGRSIGALLFTQEGESSPTLGRWPAAIVITSTSAQDAPLLPLPVSGWETVPLAPGRLGVYRRKAGILLCGDLLRSGAIPDVDGGANAYLQALEEIEALDPKLVVPRHGAPARGKREVRARIAADREYTQNLVRHVLTSMAARLPLERVLTVARDIYEDYPFLKQHLRNLEACWREFGRTGFQK